MIWMERLKSLLHTDFLPSCLYTHHCYLVPYMKSHLYLIEATFHVEDIQDGRLGESYAAPDGLHGL